jgi:tetratricopeptide (TPR) repeat protein
LQYRDALDAYSRAIRLNPYLSEVWYDLGTLYESCNQITDSLDAYQRAAELDPGFLLLLHFVSYFTQETNTSNSDLQPSASYKIMPKLGELIQQRMVQKREIKHQLFWYFCALTLR